MDEAGRIDETQRYPQIDLMGQGKSTTEGTREMDSLTEVEHRQGMSMFRLLQNYNNIQRAGAIYYPVAYQFLRELGRGRQGVVHLGLRQGARGCITEHAIKVFDPQLYRSPEEYWTDMGRIASQISRLQRLQSPHLVARHSYEETYGIGYVQMEAVNGMDLRRFLTYPHMRLAKRRSTPEEWKRFSKTLFHVESGKVYLRPELVLYLLRSALRGLERLHETGFLHSDVKPANIMIDRLGSVKIVDFGRAVLAGEELTFLLGSPMYMAPEMHRREVGIIQSDLYSLGLVGLELLRSEQLTETSKASESDLIDIKMGLADELPRILPSHVKRKKALVAILRNLLQPEPENRYDDAKDAEVGTEGLNVADKQFARAGVNTEFARELSEYISKLVDDKTDRVEVQHEGSDETESKASP
jgi:serine/threonine protein kinase